jgi:hypothetical protein
MLTHLAVLVSGVGGALVVALAPALAGRPEAGADPGILAVTRTAVLAAAAVALAWAGRRPRLGEAAWLGWAVLAAALVKLAAEDFPVGRPLTLFCALALYGAALIATARLMRSRGAAG